MKKVKDSGNVLAEKLIVMLIEHVLFVGIREVLKDNV